MTVHDLLEWGEYVLREDKEYWKEMDRIKGEIDKLVYQQRAVMAAAIIRLAVAMVTEQSSKCADCTGGYCEEECMEDEENGNKE